MKGVMKCVILNEINNLNKCACGNLPVVGCLMIYIHT